MSIVGELPLDISRPVEFASGDFDPPACGHHRQPSHRRTPSQFMILFDESFMGSRPPSPPRDHFPVSLAPSAPLTKETLDRKHQLEQSAVVSPVSQPIAASPEPKPQTSKTKSERKSKKHAKKNAANKPDIQQLYSSMWGGSSVRPKTTPRAKSENNLSLGVRRTPSGVGKFFSFLQRRSLDVGHQATNGVTSECSGDAVTDKNLDDDCESETGTVVEFDIDSDDELSSQAEDANMMHDLYSDKDKASVEEEASYSNDSIDESEFPLGPIEESNLEVQKTCESEFSDDSSMEVHRKRLTSSETNYSHSKSTIQEGDESEAVKPAEGTTDGKESCHSHNPSDSSHLESDIPLREIVTGSILQGVHDEISQKIAEEIESAKHLQEEDKLQTDVSICDREISHSVEYVESDRKSNDILKGMEEKEEMVWWGMKWVRVDPDKDFVEKVHTGLEAAGKLIAKHWRLVPLVALPLVVLVLTN